jgi:hypothetical protein
MLAAELRYLGSWVVFAGMVCVPLGLALYIGKAEHYAAIASFGLFILFFVVFAYAIIALWLRVRSRFEAANPARYGPVIFPIALLLVESNWIAADMASWRIADPKQGVDSLATLFASAALFAFFTLRDWRSRYLSVEASPVPAFMQLRREQFAAALELPKGRERRQALRPLSMRGYIRLALLGGEVVLMLILAPHIGIGAAFATSFAIVAGTFLIAHKKFEL